MPELPETETISADLDRAISGARITGVTVTRPDVLRETTPGRFAARLAGATVLHCWRRAKMIVLDLSSTDHLVVHLRFTGALLVDDGALSTDERRYSTMAIELADGRVLHFRDVRRLGTVTLMSAERFRACSAALGVEPLTCEFTATRLLEILQASSSAVKKVIMDQRRVAGIGNIYANEALWRAGVDPSRAARRVTPAEAALLREAIAARGTSLRDYRDANGERGTFGRVLDVYGRERLPCRRCGARLVGTHAIDGRATVLCVHCQQ
jgi:formamidopyrimidine-DNA glycosylase